MEMREFESMNAEERFVWMQANESYFWHLKKVKWAKRMIVVCKVFTVWSVLWSLWCLLRGLPIAFALNMGVACFWQFYSLPRWTDTKKTLEEGVRDLDNLRDEHLLPAWRKP